jgi:chitinase
VNATPDSALVPTGTVSISQGGITLATETLVAGAASFSLDPMTPGVHMLVLNYVGDSDFEPSSESVFQTVGVPTLSIQGARVIEGNRGTMNVSLMISLSTPVAEKIRVSLSTLQGTATAGEDYESASGVIEFAPGEITRSIELHVLGDTLPEEDETFSVLLSDPVNATIETAAAVVVIVNDDQVPPRHRAARH